MSSSISSSAQSLMPKFSKDTSLDTRIPVKPIDYGTLRLIRLLRVQIIGMMNIMANILLATPLILEFLFSILSQFSPMTEI